MSERYGQVDAPGRRTPPPSSGPPEPPPPPAGRPPSVADLASHIREVTAVRPGDVLVIKMSPNMSLEQVRQTVDRLMEGMPDLKVIAVDGSVELHVLRTGEQASPRDTPTTPLASGSPERYGD